MYDVYINYPPQPQPQPPPPPSRQKKISSSSRQKKIVSSSRCTHSKVVARATSSTDRNHSKKVVVKSERATTDHRCIEIIPYNKHRGSDNQKVQKKTGVGSKSAVTFQDSKAFQAMGTVVASHASQGLIKSVEYKEKTTKGGSIKRAMKVNYNVKRDGGPSTSRSAPSVPCRCINTTSKKTSRSIKTSRVHIIDI